MSPFNLAQLVPSLDSGGVERGTIDLANFLSELKFKNHIISNGGKLVNELNSKFVIHKKLPVNTKNILKFIFIAKSIESYIKLNKINILHVRSRSPSWIVNFINSKNIKTIGSYHNVYGGNSFFKKIYNKNLSNMDYVLAISNYVKDSIVKKYNIDNSKITVINRGIDEKFLNKPINENKKLNFIDKLNIDINKKIMLYPGRITDWKGQLKFISNFKKIKRTDTVLYFVGDTKNISHVKSLNEKIKKERLSDQCKIVGKLDKEDLKIFYSISNLVLSLSIRPEGFGRTISETILMKKPLLAFNHGGAKEQLEGISPLYSCDPLNYDELSEKINKILNCSEENLVSIQDTALNIINKKYTKDIMVNNYKNFYEKISSQ